MLSVTADRSPGPATIQRRPRRRNVKRGLTVLLFMSPWILGFLLLILYPMLSSLYFSFTKYSLLEHPVWIGLENYTFMFTKDPFFWLAFRNTIWIIAGRRAAADRVRRSSRRGC